MCISIAIRLCECISKGFCCFSNHSSKLMRKDIKISYGLLQLFLCLFIFLVVYYVAGVAKFMDFFFSCPNKESLSSCLGLSTAYRFSACLAVFHLLIAFACLTRDGFSKFMNEGAWGVKLFFILVMWVGTLFIGNKYFLIYAKVAMYLSGAYLFVQMVSLIDSMYLLAEYWAKKYDDGNKAYGFIMILVMFIFYGALGFLTYISFLKFWISSCYVNKFILISLPIFTVVYFILIFLNFHPKGSVITASAISLYTTFLSWMALISNPSKDCNPLKNDNTSMIIQLAFCILIGFACTIYWAVSHLPASGAYQDARLDVLPVSGSNDHVDEKEEEKILEEEDQEREKQKKNVEDGLNNNLIDTTSRATKDPYWAYKDFNYVKFHVFMALFSIYICPLFSNWGTAPVNGGNFGKTEGQVLPFVIKIVTCYGALFLYLWTIVAPQILTEREFDE